MNIAVQNARKLFRKAEARHWAWYAAKAAALLLLLGAFAAFGTHMHTVEMGLLWAVLSCLSALGYAYFRVIRKASRRYLFESGRQISRLNSGRILTFLIAFAAATMCVFGLFCYITRWNTFDWCIVASAAVFYPLAYFALHRLIGGQFAEEFRRAGITRTTIWITIGYLYIAFLLANIAAPVVNYPSAYEAFAAAQQEFGESPVELLRELGILSSVAEGMTNWITSQAANTSPYLYSGLKISLNALSLAAVGSMIGACSISQSELKRIFVDLPSNASDNEKQRPSLRWRYAIAGACMPVLLFVLLLEVNANLQEASDRDELSFAKNFASSAINLTVYAIDGETYDAQAIQAANDEALNELSELSAETRKTLIPLVNESFDARIANIDSYLDDYYNLPAEYERLANLVGGNVEEFAKQRLQEKIDSGVDDSELASKLERYGKQRQEILDQFEDAKLSSKIEGIPEWIVKSEYIADTTPFNVTLEADQELMDLKQRFGISAASGTAAGVVTKAVSKKLIDRTTEKQFFKNVTARISSVLASRATGGAVGGAIGTAAGPVGTVAGIAAGTAASIGIDWALLKVDENQNRETYKEQITQAIEEERHDVLSLLE